ncbi:Ku protein [Phyllobacterium sp. 628]|uniref:non-homologous end joining protein Ku n=1 Tax=Phyllobacterium sp. 628 TaxID=2718938 RepID=UPI0035305458
MPRANWKGFLKIAELSCPVALYTAASTSDRIAFHTLNRATGHRVRRQYIDSETGKPVESEDQVKGYEIGSDDYVVLEPDEVAAAVPESDKTLSIEAFVKVDAIDDVYMDKPYYLSPSDSSANEVYNLVREAMKSTQSVALVRTVLFRRMRTVLIQAHDNGLIATTLNFDYEVRSAKDAFDSIPEMKISGEMLDLAKHIIGTKKGTFDPEQYDDRYEAALADLVKAKMEGKTLTVPKRASEAKVVDLMQALRESAGIKAGKSSTKGQKKSVKKPAASTQKKAG